MRLFLCEKPSQGKDIGRVLGATQRGNGCLNGAGVTVTWCIGHLVEAAAPEAYDAQLKRWSIEQLPIIPERWRVEVKPQTAAQFKVVKALVAKATHLVIATDADREGELIAREIIDLCGYRGSIERLWLSALNDASIRTALNKLRPSAETLPLYHSALARSRADWMVGMNLSRLFTLLGRKAGYNGVLSVGRVQTPTLKLVVDRDREIAKFVAVPYWAIDVGLSANAQAFSAQWLVPKASADDAASAASASAASAALADAAKDSAVSAAGTSGHHAATAGTAATFAQTQAESAAASASAATDRQTAAALSATAASNSAADAAGSASLALSAQTAAAGSAHTAATAASTAVGAREIATTAQEDAQAAAGAAASSASVAASSATSASASASAAATAQTGADTARDAAQGYADHMQDIIDQSGVVLSVAGRTGAVVLSAEDIAGLQTALADKRTQRFFFNQL